MTRRLIAAAALCLSIAGCGTDADAPGTGAGPALKLTAPVAGQVVRGSTVAVRGITPEGYSEIRVAGEKAVLRKGLFEARVPLEAGENVIDVVAVGAGKEPATTNVSVVQVPRDRALVPDVIDERLDEAQVHLTDAGFGYDTVGGGVAGIVNETNWTVCDTTPDVGSAVPPGATVTLVVRRVC